MGTIERYYIMKTTKSSVVTVKVIDGYNLDKVTADYTKQGKQDGKDFLSHVTSAGGKLVSYIIPRMHKAYAARESIGMTSVMQVYWDAFKEAAGTAYSDFPRARVTKSECMLIVSAWMHGYTGKLVTWNATVKAARAFEDARKVKAGTAKPKTKKDTEKDATPKANNAANADKFIRQQCAMLLAYCEKNKAMLPEALTSAVHTFNDDVSAVLPTNE